LSSAKIKLKLKPNNNNIVICSQSLIQSKPWGQATTTIFVRRNLRKFQIYSKNFGMDKPRKYQIMRNEE